LVVEAAEEGDRDDRADRLDRAADRGVFRKSEVDTGAVVVVGVGTEDLAKMGFAQDQDMVQAFSSDRADEPFGVTVLPGSGILQADAYGGYGKLYEAARGPASVVEASCWAHARRKFFELGLALGEPGSCRLALTFWAVPVAAGVIGDSRVGAVLAAHDMPAECRRAATLDRRHHLELAEADMDGVSLPPRRSVTRTATRSCLSPRHTPLT
jgi:Transposase IS66 family